MVKAIAPQPPRAFLLHREKSKLRRCNRGFYSSRYAEKSGEVLKQRHSRSLRAPVDTHDDKRPNGVSDLTLAHMRASLARPSNHVRVPAMSDDGILTIGSKRLVPRKTMAKKIRVTEMTLRRWEHDGTGPPVIYLGYRPYYDEAVTDRWLEKKFRKAEAAE